MSERLTIDGSQGEGGGQILRTALALSLAFGRPFRIERIRASRRKPGLLRQHLTAVQAAALVSGGTTTGATLESQVLEFAPGQVRGGEYRLAIGTAGSATLVLQAVLPALMLARESSRLTLEGGTHNPAAPPFDFLEKALLPLLRRMGARVKASIRTYGFYPAGGGSFIVDIEPCAELSPLMLEERGGVQLRARALVSSLPESIAFRELVLVKERFNLDRGGLVAQHVDSPGPGNVLMVECQSDSVTEVVTGFGIKGVRSEQVASEVCSDVEAYLAAAVPIGRHLADQLLLPMTLARGGTIRTVNPTLHTRTNADVIRQFVDVPIAINDEGAGAWRIQVGPAEKGQES